MVIFSFSIFPQLQAKMNGEAMKDLVSNHDYFVKLFFYSGHAKQLYNRVSNNNILIIVIGYQEPRGGNRQLYQMILHVGEDHPKLNDVFEEAKLHMDKLLKAKSVGTAACTQAIWLGLLQ